MCDSSSEFRHRLAADRMAALRRCAEHGPPSSLRRAVGSGLVRLGLRLRSDGSVPPLVSQLGTDAGPPTTVGGSPSVATSRTGEG
jgi:hypothetical protein